MVLMVIMKITNGLVINYRQFYSKIIYRCIFQKCLQNGLSTESKISAFNTIQGEFDRAKGDVDSKRIFLDQSFRDYVTSDSKLDMEKCSELVQNW